MFGDYRQSLIGGLFLCGAGLILAAPIAARRDFGDSRPERCVARWRVDGSKNRVVLIAAGNSGAFRMQDGFRTCRSMATTARS